MVSVSFCSRRAGFSGGNNRTETSASHQHGTMTLPSCDERGGWLPISLTQCHGDRLTFAARAELGIAAIWSQKIARLCFWQIVGHQRHPAGGFLPGRRRKTGGPFFPEHAGRSENSASHSKTVERRAAAGCDACHRFGDLSHKPVDYSSSKAPGDRRLGKPRQ